MEKILTHANQLADKNNFLQFGKFEIRGKVSKNEKFYIAVVATKTVYSNDENTNGNDIDYSEEYIPMEDAIAAWARPMNVAHLVDNLIAVRCADNQWRPLVFKTDLGWKAMHKNP